MNQISYPQGASTKAFLRVLKTILQAGTWDYAFIPPPPPILKLPASKTSMLLPYCHIAVRQLSHPWQLQINLEIAVRKKRFWCWKASLTTNSVLNSCGFSGHHFLIKKSERFQIEKVHSPIHDWKKALGSILRSPSNPLNQTQTLHLWEVEIETLCTVSHCSRFTRGINDALSGSVAWGSSGSTQLRW